MYFWSQCNSLPNDSKLPENQTYITETKLSSFDTEDEDICKILTLYIKKTHGHDEVSMRVLKLCDKIIIKPLSIIFKNCKLKKTFPNLWKKANVVPIHKKRKKRYLKKLSSSYALTDFWKNFRKTDVLTDTSKDLY